MLAKKTIIAISFMVFAISLSACVSSNLSTDTSISQTTYISESTDPAPTTIPTYAPGTELYGMLSVTGEVVIEPKYEYLDLFSEEGLARFCDHGRWGFVNTNGEEVIPAQYKEANNFSEGMAAVKVEEKWGFIDTSGDMVIKPQFEGVQEGCTFGRCLIFENGEWGIIDQTGQIIVPPQYVSIELYCKSYFIVQSSEKTYGIIDRDGGVVVECQFSDIYAVTDSGYFFQRGSDIENCDLMVDITGNRYYVNKDYPNYPLYRIQSDSIISFSSDGARWGLIDLETSVVVVEEAYDYVTQIPGERFAYTMRDNYKGMVDVLTGETILDCMYKELQFEYEYVVYQNKSDKWGVMDWEGHTIIEAKYSDFIICSPHEEFAYRKNNVSYIMNRDHTIKYQTKDLYFLDYVASIDSWVVSESDRLSEDRFDGLMKSDGTILIEPIYRLYFDFNVQGLFPHPIDPYTAPFIVTGYKGEGTDRSNVLVNSSGYVFDCPADNAHWFPDQGVLVVSENKKNGLISYDGKILFEPQECRIFINKDAGEEAGEYEYETYNDTDYLIYTVAAK